MLPKYFPVILVANDSSGLHFKTVNSAEEHAAFCTRYVGPDTVLETIRTFGALHREITSEEYMIETFRRIVDESELWKLRVAGPDLKNCRNKNEKKTDFRNPR